MAGIAALTVAGCTPSTPDDPASEDTIVPASLVGALAGEVPEEYADGLTVATQADIAPLSYTNEEGEVVGFDQDLIVALSEVLGVPITAETVTFENLLLGVDSGKYDFVGDTTISAARMEKYDMVSYHTSSFAVGTLADAPEMADDITELCGMSVGIITGELSGTYVLDTADPACAEAGLDAVATTEYKDIPSTILAVQSGNVAAMIIDSMSYGYFLTTDAGEDFRFNGPSRISASDGGYSFAKGGSQELALLIQKALTLLVDDGIYKELLENYGISSIAIAGEPELNPEAAI